MIRKFQVKNFKNFRDTLFLDFTNVHDYKYNEYCVTKNLISKMIVYGRNSVGKSNLGMALFDIALDAHFTRSPYSYRNDTQLFKNANASDDELVEFYYSFQFDNDVVDYIYKKRDFADFVSETLIINGKQIFYYDLISEEQNFNNVDLINANKLNWEQFIDSLKKEESDMLEPTTISALRYIIYNTVQTESDIIYKLSQFIKGMRFTQSAVRASYISPFAFKEICNNPDELKKFEKFLNDYGVECELIVLDQADGKKDLYFNYNKPLHFSSNLSSGTLLLTIFYLQYLSRNKPSFIFIDEFDAFYHFELSEKIVNLLENEFECQVILTSHNTNLLSNSIMRPDCFMILNNGKLTPICEATNRELRQGHNLEKLYMNGEFDE